MSSILIVEDEVLTSEYLEFVLQEAGYEAIPAASAEEAIEVLEHRDDVDLVVTDINLPGGIERLAIGGLSEKSLAGNKHHRRNGLQCAQKRRNPVWEPVRSKAVQRPKNDRRRSSLSTLNYQILLSQSGRLGAHAHRSSHGHAE